MACVAPKTECPPGAGSADKGDVNGKDQLLKPKLFLTPCLANLQPPVSPSSPAHLSSTLCTTRGSGADAETSGVECTESALPRPLGPLTSSFVGIIYPRNRQTPVQYKMAGFFGGPIYNPLHQTWKKSLVVESTGKIPLGGRSDELQVLHLGKDISQINTVYICTNS